MIENVIIIAVVLLIVVSIFAYLYRAKKNGQHCIGCPYAKKCGGNCCGKSAANIEK